MGYGEFMYKAGPWPYEGRVVCKVEKPENQMVYLYTFIVTNMDSSPEYLVKFYCKKGQMENFIKESKSGFDFSVVSSHSRIVNANMVQIHALAYNSEWMSPSSIGGGGITNFLRRGDNPLLSYTLREDAQ